MAKLFQIMVAEGMSEVKLDSQRRATVQYTVKNVSARPIDGRAVLVALPQTSPKDPNHPVQKGWIKLAGNADQHFETDKDGTYTVNISAPAINTPGTFSFRLDVVSTARPDDGDWGPPLKFTLASGPPPKPFPWWIVAVAAAVLCVAGVVTWLLLKPKTPAESNGQTATTSTGTSGQSVKVPKNLVGMTLSDASKALQAAHLNVGVIQGDGQTVISSKPLPGQDADNGSVDLTTATSSACTPPCRFSGRIAVESHIRSTTLQPR